MTDQIEAQSPLNTIPSANRPALSMRERPLRGYLNLRGQPEQNAFTEAVRAVLGVAPPTTPNTVIESDTSSLLWLAPNEWLVVTASGAQDTLRDQLRQAFGDLFAAVTDVSSGYTTIELKGHEARALLARGCALDLHPRSVTAGDCAQTLLAKADVVVVGVDASPCFHVIVRRSLAAYLWHWLDDAARDVLASARG